MMLLLLLDTSASRSYIWKTRWIRSWLYISNRSCYTCLFCFTSVQFCAVQFQFSWNNWVKYASFHSCLKKNYCIFARYHEHGLKKKKKILQNIETFLSTQNQLGLPCEDALVWTCNLKSYKLQTFCLQTCSGWLSSLKFLFFFFFYSSDRINEQRGLVQWHSADITGTIRDTTTETLMAYVSLFVSVLQLKPWGLGWMRR